MHNAIDKIAQCSDLPARRPADKRYLPMRNGIPNLSALQAFEASARLGSFSRAAEELALTHRRSEEHTSELQSLMRIPSAVFRLKKKNKPCKITRENYSNHSQKNVTSQS